LFKLVVKLSIYRAAADADVEDRAVVAVHVAVLLQVAEEDVRVDIKCYIK
jgi:hypothetical protein